MDGSKDFVGYLGQGGGGTYGAQSTKLKFNLMSPDTAAQIAASTRSSRFGSFDVEDGKHGKEDIQTHVESNRKPPHSPILLPTDGKNSKVSSVIPGTGSSLINEISDHEKVEVKYNLYFPVGTVDGSGNDKDLGGDKIKIDKELETEAVVEAKNVAGPDDVARKLRYQKIGFVVFLLAVIGIFAGIFARGGEDYIIEEMKYEGITRQYVYHGPVRGTGKQAIVVVLHGYCMYAPDMIEMTGMNDVADSNGFAVVYPFGTNDKARECPFFNVGYTFNKDEKVDDAGFIAALYTHVSVTHNLHSENFFVTGFSNGGDLIYLLACQYPHVIRAAASVSGMMLDTIKNSDTCMYPTALQASRAMPLLELHGTADIVTPWDGDLLDAGGWGVFPSQPNMIKYWTDRYNCTKHQQVLLPRKNDPTKQMWTKVHKYSNCQAAQKDEVVWLYQAFNGTHSWSAGELDYSTSTVVWNFFSNYLVI